MKTLKRIVGCLLVALVPACLVVGVHPLYTVHDLFPNRILIGSWVDQDSARWKFAYRPTMVGDSVVDDSTCYILQIKEKGKADFHNSSLEVRLLRLGDYCFADFYLSAYRENDNQFLFDVHVFPVHSYARLDLENGVVHLRWFNPDWLKRLAQDGKLPVSYEVSDGNYLLTANTPDLKRFVLEHADNSEAYAEGVDFFLHREP